MVKNAYDADANKISIRFVPPLLIGEGSIEVIDDGIGMSAETLETAWMEPATRFKADNTTSPKGRRVLGEKGIGRFAASRLSNEMYVVTKQEGAANETRAFFDWTQFDQEDKFLDEVQMVWDQVPAAEISPLGTLGQLFESYSSKTDADCHGTILRLDKLRSQWDERELEKLRMGLSRLVSPVAQAAGANGCSAPGKERLSIRAMYAVAICILPPMRLGSRLAAGTIFGILWFARCDELACTRS